LEDLLPFLPFSPDLSSNDVLGVAAGCQMPIKKSLLHRGHVAIAGVDLVDDQ
jgi:hypothetical protein